MRMVDVAVFGDVFYYSCKFNPLLSGLLTATGTVMPYMEYDLFPYSFDDGVLSVQRVGTADDRELFRLAGAGLTELGGDDIIEEVKWSVMSGGTVFMPFDYFELPGMVEYHESHLGHYYLIYGFDDRRSEMLCYEANDREERRACTEFRLAYEVVPRGYACYRDQGWPERAARIGRRDTGVMDGVGGFGARFVAEDEMIRRSLAALERAVDYFGRPRSVGAEGWALAAECFKVAERTKRLEVFRSNLVLSECDEWREGQERILILFEQMKGLALRLSRSSGSLVTQYLLRDKMNEVFEVESCCRDRVLHMARH